MIIDGQQRINAICRFARNEIRLPEPKREKTGLPKFLVNQDCPWAGRQFNQLTREDSERFLNTKLSVIRIEPEQENEIRDLFIRLQSGLPLSTQEKRDAWPGQFSEFVIQTAGKRGKAEGHDFFQSVMRLGNGGRTDPKRRLACAQLYMLLDTRREHGPLSFCNLGSQDIDNFYHFHVDFINSCETAERFTRILDIVHEILGDGKRPPIKTHLAIHVFLIVDSLLDDFGPDWMPRLPKAVDRFMEQLATASKNKALSNEYWRRYGSKAIASSTSRDTIRDRHHFFVERVLEYMGENGGLRRKDSTRAFTSYERELLYLRGKKNCAICGKVVDWNDAEAHHIDPHASGGITSLEDAQLVHSGCHPRGPVAGPIQQTGSQGPLWEAENTDDQISAEGEDKDEEGDGVDVKGLTKKEQGDVTRTRFLAMLAEKGIQLEPVSRREYRDFKGRRVLVPTANKPTGHGRRVFFLGARASDFRLGGEIVLVLLCRRGERVLPFVLPPETVRQVIGRLKPAGDDQYKFNVVRSGTEKYDLRLGGGNSMDLTPYLDNFPVLR